jgi:WbqC-like protein family
MNADAATSPASHRRVAVLQSNYIPWKGYFDIIRDADLFVFYDDLQFTKNDWRNRNQVKAVRGCEWISVPVGDSIDRLICDVEITDSTWQAKHWRTLQQNYSRSPHFGRYREYFEHVYLGRRWTNLSELNHSLIRHIAKEFLGINTAFADSRDYQVSGQKLDRLFDLVVKSGAKSYISGPSARDYMVPERFERAGIELVWKDYSGYPSYPQRFPPFEHKVSVVDLLFNVGPESPYYIWGWREIHSL